MVGRRRRHRDVFASLEGQQRFFLSTQGFQEVLQHCDSLTICCYCLWEDNKHRSLLEDCCCVTTKTTRTETLGHHLTFHSLCLCVCLCNRAPAVPPITGRNLPGACPPSVAAPSTLHLLRSPRCPLCTVALPHGQRVPAHCTGLPDTAKHQGSSWIKGKRGEELVCFH